MNELLSSLNYQEVIVTVWTVVILPVLTYIGKQIGEWAKERKIDKYTDALEYNVINAVKDVYETIVKDIKGTEVWTDEKKNMVKEIAKQKAINALSRSAYDCLKLANEDFEEYLDSLIGTALYDIKNGLQ